MTKEIEPIKEGGKYFLQDSPIDNKQIEFIFSRTPKHHKHKRPAKGGGEWEYVTGVYVKKALNYLFGWLWDFEVVDKGNVEVGGKIIQVWVQGRLTIKRQTKGGIEVVLVKTQFGGADVKYKKSDVKFPLDYANDLKAATTDALKKCASEIGIASDVYGKNEFQEISQPMAEKKEEVNKVDYLFKLKEVLEKVKRKDESLLETYNRITGDEVKSLALGQAKAKTCLFNLLNNPICQNQLKQKK